MTTIAVQLYGRHVSIVRIADHLHVSPHRVRRALKAEGVPITRRHPQNVHV